MDIAIILRIAFLVCLPSSVTHRGVASSMFIADNNRGSKVCSLGVDEHAGTRYSFAFVGKNLHSSRWSVVFFPASAEHPFSPVVQVCQRANKLQTAIIRIKKISPYDTEQQTYQKYELHSFSSSYRIKKGGKSDRDDSRSDCRSASLGDTKTDIPRRRLDNINPYRNRDNLLDYDTLKTFTTMATKRHSKTWEQQAKYYGVENIAEYMVETFLNGNISTFRELYKELKPAGRKLFISWLFHMEIPTAEIEKIILATF